MKDIVYALLETIPRGKVATYGQIAARLGNVHMARAVGNILHKNPDPTRFPCHRVVDSQGRVAKHFAFGGAEAQKALLESEGVLFGENGRIDLQRYCVKEM